MTIVRPPSIADRIERAFEAASKTTGTSFDYLLQTAQRESNFNTNAKAPTSTASGLFQFIESTWFEVMKESGPALGFSEHARHIERTSRGGYVVKDAEKRAEILNLRNDPGAASMLAGAYTRSNAKQLSARLGRTPSSGELYIAHFLGPRGAEKLIGLAERSPNQNAAATFPAQARANRSIFYTPAGKPRTASEVYGVLSASHAQTANAVATTAKKPAPAATPTQARQPLTTAAFLPPQNANNRVEAGWNAASSNAPFDVLFRTGPSAPRDLVGPAFWSAYTAADAKPVKKPVTINRPLDLTAVQDHEPPATTAPGQSVNSGTTERRTARRSSGPLDLTGFLDLGNTRRGGS